LEQAVVAEPIGPTVIEESPCGHARRQRALECWQTHTEPDSAPGAMLGANLQALSAHGKQACVVAAWAASARLLRSRSFVQRYGLPVESLSALLKTALDWLESPSPARRRDCLAMARKFPAAGGAVGRSVEVACVATAAAAAAPDERHAYAFCSTALDRSAFAIAREPGVGWGDKTHAIWSAVLAGLEAWANGVDLR